MAVKYLYILKEFVKQEMIYTFGHNFCLPFATPHLYNTTKQANSKKNKLNKNIDIYLRRWYNLVTTQKLNRELTQGVAFLFW